MGDETSQFSEEEEECLWRFLLDEQEVKSYFYEKEDKMKDKSVSSDFVAIDKEGFSEVSETGS